MTAIRIQVTAEDIAAAERGENDPVEIAITRIAGVGVICDHDVPVGWMATLGASGSGATLVVNLPATASAFLDRWVDGDIGQEPIEFDLEIDAWLSDLVRRAS